MTSLLIILLLFALVLVSACSQFSSGLASRRLAASDVSAYCADLSSLESHMQTNLEALGFTVASFPCLCTLYSDRFFIDCKAIYSAGDDVYWTNFEQAAFNLDPITNEFVLIASGWGDTFLDPDGNFQEAYQFTPEGLLASCDAADGCASCAICPDGVSVEVDCSTFLPELGLSYSYTCQDAYPGSFFNTFGLIKVPTGRT